MHTCCKLHTIPKLIRVSLNFYCIKMGAADTANSGSSMRLLRGAADTANSGPSHSSKPSVCFLASMKSFSLAVVLAVASALSPESLAAYKATHPERFTHEYTNEDITQHMLSHHAHTHDTVSVETHDHHETHKPEEVAAWKASHSEHEHHETHTPEEVAAWKASHPEHEHHEHPMNYTAAEVAAWKASHPEFEHRSHLDAVAKIAAYKAAHAEHFEHFGRSDCEEPPKMLQVVPSHHAYSAAELVVFAAGMTHAKQVEGYKASHTTEFTPQAVAAYKKSHPERVAVAVMMEVCCRNLTCLLDSSPSVSLSDGLGQTSSLRQRLLYTVAVFPSQPQDNS